MYDLGINNNKIRGEFLINDKKNCFCFGFPKQLNSLLKT